VRGINRGIINAGITIPMAVVNTGGTEVSKYTQFILDCIVAARRNEGTSSHKKMTFHEVFFLMVDLRDAFYASQSAECRREKSMDRVELKQLTDWVRENRSMAETGVKRIISNQSLIASCLIGQTLRPFMEIDLGRELAAEEVGKSTDTLAWGLFCARA